MSKIHLVLLFAFFYSCSTIDKSQLNSPIKVSIESDMAAKVDVDLTRKLTGYASGGYLFHLFKISGDNKYLEGVSYNGHDGGYLSFISKVAKVRAAAAYNAIRTSDADILVNPQYVVEESNWNPFYKLIKVKVVGNPGRIISIKNK